MRFSHFAFIPALVAGAPSLHPRQSTCTDPALRKEWRTLSDADKASYIAAVKCLSTKPSRIGLSTPLYQDFPYVHNILNNDIHFVANFLPWHRYFLHLYESALQTECGLVGTVPYWDWTLDSLDPSSSPIWDAATGFGGNNTPESTQTGSDGRPVTCVAEGPFTDLTLEYFGTQIKPHCLSRNFNNGTELPGRMLGEYYTPQVVDGIMQLGTYDEFRRTLESGPHGAVHSAVGGDMSPSTSPNDPIFFLHHAQIDRLWTLWQKQDPATRTTEYSGIRTQDQFDGVTPPQATLDDVLPYMGIAAGLMVREVMSSESDLMCFTY